MSTEPRQVMLPQEHIEKMLHVSMCVWAFFVSIIFVPALSMVQWGFPRVVLSTLETTPSMNAPYSFPVNAVIVLTAIFSAVLPTQKYRYSQLIAGTIMLFGALVGAKIGADISGAWRGSTECAQLMCWPRGWQEFSASAPMICAALAMIILGVFFQRWNIWVRRIIPVFIFVSLFILLAALWESDLIPIFQAPPSEWILGR